MIKYKTQQLEVVTYSMVALFDSSPTLDNAYSSIVKTEGLSEYNNSTVGEKSAFVTKQTGIVGVDVYFVFIRCKALAVIHLWNIDEKDISSYGQRLDNRLKPLVCP